MLVKAIADHVRPNGEKAIDSGAIYLVLASYLLLSGPTFSFRIIDNSGEPMVHPAERFTVLSGSLSNFVLSEPLNDKDYYIFDLNAIRESKYEKLNPEGFYGYFFDNPYDDEMNLFFQSVVRAAALKEGVQPPSIRRFYE